MIESEDFTLDFASSIELRCPVMFSPFLTTDDIFLLNSSDLLTASSTFDNNIDAANTASGRRSSISFLDGGLSDVYPYSFIFSKDCIDLSTDDIALFVISSFFIFC